jgi:two-component system sensor histidine kinase KdpD
MRTRGVLVLRVADPATLAEPDNRRLAEAVAALAAQTLERLHYIAVAQQTLVAMESERLRHSLLAALSHDLRTPLTALTGQAETLQRQLAREASPHAAQAATLQTQSQRISRLVTNLLEMARLQAGGVTLRRDWLPPQELFGSAIAALGGATASHRLQVDAPLDCPMLYADPILLERLLVNLLENALKYSPAGSTITLAASASAQHILLSVADQGRGLPPGNPDALFTAFTRGERESAISGVGLGLAICRTIADVHGGRISAANLPAGGARFTLSLPLAPQPALDFDPENL